MTHVEFNFTQPDGEPDHGTVTFTPTRRNNHEKGLALPEPFAVNLTGQGTFTADLAPTPPHWLWRITVQVNSQPWDTGYYYVPDRHFPIRFTDMHPVDPSTVQTGLNPEPAWWAHIDAVKASADEIAETVFTSRTEAEKLDGVVQDIEAVRDDARTAITADREAVAQSRRLTTEQANRAEREASAAYHSAAEARASAASAAHSASEAADRAEEVEQAVIHVERSEQAATAAEQSATSAEQSAVSASGDADRAEAARDQTIANSVEVNTDAGTRVSIGGVNVFYDSGWRNVSEWLNSVVDQTNSIFRIRRTLNQIHIELQYTFSDPSGRNIVTIPVGPWQPVVTSSSPAPRCVFISQSPENRFHLTGINRNAVLQWRGAGSEGADQNGPTGEGQIVTVSITLPAPPQLPTTLPGAPA